MSDVIHLPFEAPAERGPLDQYQRDLAEVRAALTLVAEGVARTVAIAGLQRSADVAPAAIAAGQQAGIPIRVERRSDGSFDFVVGPRLAAK